MITRFSCGARSTLTTAIKILRNIGTQFFECDCIVLNIVGLYTLYSNFTRGDGSVQNQTPRDETRREIRSSQCPRSQVVCSKRPRLQLVRCNRSIDNVFSGNRIVCDFGSVDRPVCNFCRRDSSVSDLVNRDGERRYLFRSYRAILDILRINNPVTTHTEPNLDPLGLKTIDRQGSHRRNQNVAVAEIDETVAADISSIPRLFDMKPRANIERRVYKRIDRPCADDDRISSTRVGGHWVII